uniref:Uncharacterized protein n=1 Tax=Anopheles atroparvus TaxID=41427 RepID=A0A182JJ14_ANOAO
MVDELAVCVTRSGDPPIEVVVEVVVAAAPVLVLPPFEEDTILAGDAGMPSLLALPLPLLWPPLPLSAVGMTVFSRNSDESSDTPKLFAPAPFAPPLLLLPDPSVEEDEPSPSEPLLTPWLLPTDDSMVELTSGILVEEDVEWTESAVLLRTDSRLPRMFSFRLKPTLLRVLTSATPPFAPVAVLPPPEPPPVPVRVGELPRTAPDAPERPTPVRVVLLPQLDAAVDAEIKLSSAFVDWANVGSWVLSRFCTVRSKRNASWASFSGSTSLLEIGRVWVGNSLPRQEFVNNRKL